MLDTESEEEEEESDEEDGEEIEDEEEDEPFEDFTAVQNNRISSFTINVGNPLQLQRQHAIKEDENPHYNMKQMTPEMISM